MSKWLQFSSCWLNSIWLFNGLFEPVKILHIWMHLPPKNMYSFWNQIFSDCLESCLLGNYKMTMKNELFWLADIHVFIFLHCYLSHVYPIQNWITGLNVTMLECNHSSNHKSWFKFGMHLGIDIQVGGLYLHHYLMV